MKQSVYAELPAYGAHAETRARTKYRTGKLLNSALGLCAEVGVALGITAIGFVLSLLCGW